MFDFEPDEDFVHEMLVNDYLSNTTLNENIFDLGFETFNPITNAGGTYLVFSAIIIIMAVIALVNLIKSLKKKFVIQTTAEGGKNEL